MRCLINQGIYFSGHLHLYRSNSFPTKNTYSAFEISFSELERSEMEIKSQDHLRPKLSSDKLSASEIDPS